MTEAFRVLFVLLSLAPARDSADMLFRYQIAHAIVLATPDTQRQDVLARLAFYESSFRADVADCRVRGDHGVSLGLFQVQPRTAADVAALCGTLEDQARIALARVEESVAMCRHLTGPDLLSGYTRGRCVRGDRKARERWAP